MTYTYDPKRRIWLSPGNTSLTYSDGDIVEDRLLVKLKQAYDVSTASLDLIAAIDDWPSEYHFSPTRHNLLRPFEIGPEHSVLELGCGCGAMTRYLGETGAKVCAVEGSQRRATLAAERCRDLPNVSIYCDNISTFESEKKFDVVTLIGVLEYSTLFIPRSNPVDDCLRMARSHLASGGWLIVAIENQLGLKYFNGCSEDHTGIPYFGVHDLYGQDTVVTLGKKELSAKVLAAGFKHTHCYLPFPDYKLPSLILSEGALENSAFQVTDLLMHIRSRDYTGRAHRNFDEALAWHSIIRNGLLSDLSNSFLLCASDHPLEQQTGKLGWSFSTGRLPAYSGTTRFMEVNESISVIKEKMHVGKVPPDNTEPVAFHVPAAESPYIAGTLYTKELHRLLAKSSPLSTVVKWAQPWVNRLLSEARSSPDNKHLPATWLDATPANFIIDAQGHLELIDFEWQAASPVPVVWVLLRGVIQTFRSCPLTLELEEMTFRELLTAILAPECFPLAEEDYRTAAKLEDMLSTQVYGQRHGSISTLQLFESRISRYSTQPSPRMAREASLNAEVSALEDHLQRIHRSLSWRVTAPLRWINGLIRPQS